MSSIFEKEFLLRTAMLKKYGIASNHGDPEHLWQGLGMSYTMDGFRKDVAAAMGNSDKSPAADAKYYVQVGAFANRTNAETYLAQVKKTYPDAFIKKF